MLTHYAPNQISPAERFAPASFQHLLGTDHLGRDLFARVLYGGRVALSIALGARGASLAIGLVLGLIAGYGPRWLNNILLLLFDAVKSFPTVMLALTLVTVTGPSLMSVVLVVVLASVPGYTCSQRVRCRQRHAALPYPYVRSGVLASHHRATAAPSLL